MEDDLGLGTIPVTGDLYIKWGSHFIKTNKTGQEVADQVQSLQDRIKTTEVNSQINYDLWKQTEAELTTANEKLKSSNDANIAYQLVVDKYTSELKTANDRIKELEGCLQKHYGYYLDESAIDTKNDVVLSVLYGIMGELELLKGE